MTTNYEKLLEFSEKLLGLVKAVENAMSLADCPSSELIASMNAIEQLRPQLKATIAATEGEIE